jgi:nucleoid-associated protein YgaU
LDEIAFRFYGNPAYWRVLARFNSLDDPLHLPTGLSLDVPPLSLLSPPR